MVASLVLPLPGLVAVMTHQMLAGPGLVASSDLARILGVRASHLAATETDMKLEMVQNDVVSFSGHAARLKAEIDELTERLAEKKETFERVRKLLGESQKEFDRLHAEGTASHG
jgi:septal ring factor EnvC (AmiA/AmiB activator)